MRVPTRGPGPDRCGKAAVAIVALAMGLVATAGLAHAGAADPDTPAVRASARASEPAALDQVVADVVRMLEAKVSERVVVHWLETSGARPASVGSREIVALGHAGASDALIDRLLDLAAQKASGGERGAPGGPAPAGAETPAGPAPAAQAPGGPAPAAAAPRAVVPPAAPPPVSSPPRVASPAAVEGQAAPGHAASFHWSIAYHPDFGADDERWDLYVYLDGRYVAWVKSPIVSLIDPPLHFDRSLPPGRHVVRVVEERHLRRLGGSRWTHQARVAPAALAFDVAADAAGSVELRVEGHPRRGPIALKVTQGEGAPVKVEPAVSLPEAWPALCEEVTAGKSAGQEPSRAARRELASCLHWSDLWPGVAPPPPSRDAVRAELERRGFHPDPARSGD